MQQNLKSHFIAAFASLFVWSAAPSTVHAGSVFLTGHDPDFHSQPGLGDGGTLLAKALSFVTGGTFNDGVAATKFLWVESDIAAPGGHVKGYNSLDDVGATLGTDYDIVNAAGFAAANLANYNAIAIASSFGGTLTRAELDALIARKTDSRISSTQAVACSPPPSAFPAAQICSVALLAYSGTCRLSSLRSAQTRHSRPPPSVYRWASLLAISTIRRTIPSGSLGV